MIVETLSYLLAANSKRDNFAFIETHLFYVLQFRNV